ncbi:MAG: arylsulfatase [bacterium]|nr:arylsulfatase [bacterium]
MLQPLAVPFGLPFLALLLPACSSAPAPRAPGPAGDRPPNVVIVITDDQGLGDFGFAGNPLVDTPHLDALAADSARLETFYVSPVCAPTRAALMTGRYCQRTRAIDTYIGRAMMAPAERTLAEHLRDAGFATGIFGKWHLGDCYPMRAMDQGFEESLVHRGGGIGQPSDPEGGEGRYTDAVLFHQGERVETEGYCTDVYFDAALEWMRAEHSAGRPFFAYVATNAPHGPFHDVPEALLEQYRARDSSFARTPWPDGHALPAEHDADKLARIFAMITNIDDNVGKLQRGLEEMGAFDDTLVLFLVDNGPNTRRYVRGMRGRKGEVYEGGVRSPLLAHWPARLSAGVASDRIAAHVDVLPTVLDACGVDVPEGIDGRSVLPLLERRDDRWPDRALFIQAHRGNLPVRYHNAMVRTQRWKLVNASGFGKEIDSVDPAFELYDMLADPLELEDLAGEQPRKVRELRAQYDAWFDDVMATSRFDPPAIHIGADAARDVHLTRQDWRRTSDDSGWRQRSGGHWEAMIVDEGPYTVRVRFPKPGVRKIELRLGAVALRSDVPESVTEWTFERVRLRRGPARIEGRLEDGAGAFGPLQVIVTKE